MARQGIPLPQSSVPDGYRKNHQVQTFISEYEEKEIVLLLEQQALSPQQQKSLISFWCTQHSAPKEELYALLQKINSPSSAQVLALDVLSCVPHPDNLSILWTVFFEARFGIRAEDPDLFTRAIRNIIQIEIDFPKSNQELFSTSIPMLMHKAVLHRDQRSLPKDVLNTLLPEYYSQYGIDGIHAFTSEGGSLFQEIITAIDEENINVPDLPLSPPAQYPGGSAPVFFQAPITQYTAQWQPPILLWSILSFSVVVVLLRIQYKRLASLLFAFSIILGGEGVLAWIDTPIQAEQSSLFSFVDFSFAPYQKHTRKDQNWWISQGGPARWQEIPEHSEIFRIAVLGASSAHASNLLQEEGFPAILEKTLQSEFPNKSIQVVNMGIGGTISNGILSSGTQAIEMGVDALIIYYGHNEVAQFQQIDQFGVSAQIWMRILFSQSRIYALLNHIFPSQPHKQQETIRTNTTARSDPERIIEWAAQNHLQNLSILLHDCSQKSIPVLQVTPTYNVLFAPFLPYSNEINTQAKRLLEEAQSLRPKNTQEAKNRVKQSIQYASNGSDVALKAHQIHAELLSEQGKLREARIEYQKIFDQADEITTIHSRVQKNILLLAQKYGTAHLDAEEVFYHHSKDGLSANELFWDELHPSQKGHQFLADAILPWARVQTSNFPDSSPNP